MHGPKRPSECLGRAVAVPHGDSQQVVAGEHVRGGDGHAPPADVLGHGHPGQRREHSTQVILGGAEITREPNNVDLLVEVTLDVLDQPIEFCDHGVPLSTSSLRVGSGATPYYSGSFESGVTLEGFDCPPRPDRA